MSLSPVNLRDDLDSIMGLGSTPSRFLPSFIHELAHHWCFQSPVGTTLACLEQRARRNALLLSNGDDSVDWHGLFADIVRYESAASLLRPLAEGIALFAEFDATSGSESSVLSELAQQTGLLFSGGLDAIRFNGFTLPLEGTRRPLAAWRSSEQCLHRKELIFGHCFDYTSGGYLPGYLAVREIWSRAAFHVHRLFQESDLFMMYLRSYIYDDLSLVELLLRTDQVSFDTSADICKHIWARYQAVSRPSEDEISRYEYEVEHRSEVSATGVLQCVQPDGLDQDSVVAQVNQLVTDLESAAASSSPAGRLARLDLEILNQRDVVRFGQADANVEITSGQCTITIEEKRALVGKALDGAVDGEAAGSVELLCSTRIDTRARAVAVRRGTELVAVLVEGPEDRNVETISRFLEVLDASTIRAHSERTSAALAEFVSIEELAELTAEMRDALLDLSDLLYGELSLGRADREERAALAEYMRTDGLLPVLDYDRQLIYALAAISVGWSLRQRREDLAVAVRQFGVELDDVLTRLEEINEEHGVPSILTAGDLVWSSV